MAEEGTLNCSSLEIKVTPSKFIHSEAVKSAVCDDKDTQSLSTQSNKTKKMKVLHEEMEGPKQTEEVMKTAVLSQGSITALNNACLLNIFRFLSWKQLIGIERVCKIWQELSLRAWQERYSIDINAAWHFESIMEIHNLEKILIKCGKHLKSLKLPYHPVSPNNSSTTELIGELCPNLEHLHMSGEELKGGISPKFLASSVNLKALVLDSSDYFQDEQLKPLIDSAKALEKLVLRDGHLDGSCLINLNKKIKHLDLSFCQTLRDREIIKVLLRSGDLKHLTLSYCRGISFDITCLELCSQSLQELCLNEVQVRLDNHFVPSFPNLRVLQITENTFMDDDFLALLVESSPNIEDLDVSGFDEEEEQADEYNVITDDGIRFLVPLNKLKSLRVSGHKNITSKSIEYLAEKLKSRELEEVDFSRCELLTNVGAKSLIAHFPKLTYLRLRKCKKIKKNLIKSALDLIKLRTNNVSLNIFVTGIPSQEFKDGDRVLLSVSKGW